ncbi:hypothetical protein GGR58DRAFT_491945 [Xylaria digitata]|nr:hypothetical protein GGR58DRAFT_491945 [Xylaria digitata]
MVIIAGSQKSGAFLLVPRLLALSVSYVSSAFVTLLLTKVSGIPLSERKYDKR